MLDELDLTVMSPGVPTDLPVVEKMREMGIPVWGENRASLMLCGKGDVLSHHRYKWKDNDYISSRSDYEEL